MAGITGKGSCFFRFGFCRSADILTVSQNLLQKSPCKLTLKEQKSNCPSVLPLLKGMEKKLFWLNKKRR